MAFGHKIEARKRGWQSLLLKVNINILLKSISSLEKWLTF